MKTSTTQPQSNPDIIIMVWAVIIGTILVGFSLGLAWRVLTGS